MKGEVTGSSERCVALLTALRSLLQVMTTNIEQEVTYTMFVGPLAYPHPWARAVQRH